MTFRVLATDKLAPQGVEIFRAAAPEFVLVASDYRMLDLDRV